MVPRPEVHLTLHLPKVERMNESSGEPSDVVTPIDLSETIESLLMSIEEYMQCSFNYPYVYELPTLKGSLQYFGSRHFTDPEDRLFDIICEAVESYDPDAIVIESEHELRCDNAVQQKEEFLKYFYQASRKDVIRSSESFLGIKLATERNIYVECPEPSLEKLLKHLQAQGFGGGDVGAYFVLRAASMAHLYLKHQSLESLLVTRAKQLAAFWPWDQKTIDVKSALEVVEQICERLALDDYDVLARKVSPVLLPNDKDYSVRNQI